MNRPAPKSETGLYILGADGRPTPEPDSRAWFEWMERADRTLAATRVAAGEDGRMVLVCTIFLAMDHARWEQSQLPILWETMIFGGPHDLEHWRYPTLQAAIEGHQRACKLALTI